MSISACIIARNEERLLRGCLSSLINNVSEIIIVIDSRTTDNTRTIAEGFGCKIIEFEQSDDTSFNEPLMRNTYLRNATQPWLLIIDCDERISEHSFEVINSNIKSLNTNVMALQFNRYEYLGNGKWSCIKMPRLIRNIDGISYTNTDLHPSLNPSIRALGGTVEDIDVPLHHLDILIKNRTNLKREYYTNRLIAQLDRNDLEDHEISDAHLFLGLEYSSAGHFGKGEYHYKKAIKLNPKIIWKQANIFLMQNYLGRGDLQQAEDISKKLIESSSECIEEACLVLAEVLIRRNKIKDATLICEQVLTQNPSASYMHINFASLLENSDPERAIDHLNQAVRLHPYLMNPIIYKNGYSPNLFSLQTSFLTSTRTIFEHFEYCFSKLNDHRSALQWSQNLEEILKKTAVIDFEKDARFDI